MGTHVLDTPLDTPAADWFLNALGNPAVSIEQYTQGYQDRRIYAAHLPARFECNRNVEADGSPHYHLYRDPEWDALGSFAVDLIAADRMISSSYGWAPNRAWKVYVEAYEANEVWDFQHARPSLTHHC